jgi:hypothetical protein
MSDKIVCIRTPRPKGKKWYERIKYWPEEGEIYTVRAMGIYPKTRTPYYLLKEVRNKKIFIADEWMEPGFPRSCFVPLDQWEEADKAIEELLNYELEKV